MTKQEREKRILARGEFSDHCHVIVGDIDFDAQGRILVGENSNAVLRHLIESKWMEGVELWTNEHKDIPLEHGTYMKVQQHVFDPLTKRIQAARD